jgi:hypothetical protein
VIAARICLAVVALLVIGWLAVMQRDVRLQERGVGLLASIAVEGRAAQAESDLRGARLLNPDRTPDLHRAVLYALAGQTRAAAALAESVARDEPDNLSAWRALLMISGDRLPRTAQRARTAIRRLDPLSARAPR